MPDRRPPSSSQGDVSPPPAAPSRPPALVRLLVPVSAVLLLAGVGAFWWASQRAPQAQTDGAIPVGVTAQGCDPVDLTVPAGRTSFVISNNSDRAAEWEILDGVMVVAERENILPGLQSTLNATLAPGEYTLVCGMLTAPRGTLRVTHNEAWANASARLELRDFLGPLGEYKVFLALQSGQAIKAAETLREAVAAGDLAAAQTAWREARAPWRRIEPLAYRLSDLDTAIDPSAAMLPGGEGDPAFTGFHRLEAGLFGQKSTAGMQPFADRLVTDLTALKTRLTGFRVDPSLLVALPGDMAARLSQGQIAAGENPHAGTDLDDISASLDGIGKLVMLLHPPALRVDPALAAEMNDKLAQTRTALDALRGADGFPPYDRIDAAARADLAARFDDLSATLSRLAPAIGGPANGGA